jgi:hypothetical protein
MIASRMSLGFLEEGLTKRAAKLPAGMKRHTLNELAKLVRAQSHMNDPEMVERRIWRASRYVISLAAAFQVCGRAFDPKAPGFGYPIHDEALHAWIIERAAIHEEIVLNDRRFGVKPEELVRVRQRTIQRDA